MKNLSKYNHNQRNNKHFVLFNHYKIHKSEKYLEISTSPRLIHILNSITADFTKFELEEIVSLKSSYSKNMFRLLKQYKHTGFLKFKIEDFRARLDIPQSYQMNDINKRVLKPIINELGHLFPNLHINKVKATKGRKMAYIEFVFEPEQRVHTKKRGNRNGNQKQHGLKSRECTPKWLLEGEAERSEPVMTEAEEAEHKKKEAEFRQY